MKDRLQLLNLSNGGHLAYEEYGDPNGTPVFFCHGWPSSHTMAELTDAEARNLGVRMISPDRPGINRSSFQANRKLIDWPPVFRQLADHLQIERFHMLAISGGAPYAFATAWAMPERVRAIAVVSGAPPIVDLTDYSGLLRLYRGLLALHRSHPRLLRALFHLLRPIAGRRVPIRFRPTVLKLLHPVDESVLRDNAAFEAVFDSSRRAWRGSAKGVIIDAEVHAAQWGFRLEDVEVPVRLWHGKEDRAFSYRIAEEISRRLPNCCARIIDGAGHYSLPIRYMHEILEDLIAV
jgi:pimeloyl-ACP methyl ester carboxylesterase